MNSCVQPENNQTIPETISETPNQITDKNEQRIEEPTNKETNEVTHVKDEDRIGKIISGKSYHWYEDGSTATITFQSDDAPSSGSMTLTSTIHILEFRIEGDRNAIDAVVNPDVICRFEYTYDIRGNYIHAKFVKSICNYDAADRTFTFNESNSTISIFSNEGEMIFN
jgi:hypothetical protein